MSLEELKARSIVAKQDGRDSQSRKEIALLSEKSIIEGNEEIEDKISVSLLIYCLVYWFSIHPCYMFRLSTSVTIRYASVH